MQTGLPKNIEMVAYKCAKCGMESSVKEAFVVKRSIFSRQKNICFECEQKNVVRGSAIQLGFFLISAILLFLIFPRSFFSSFLSLFLLVLLIDIPFTILHELAHASVGWLLDFDVFSIHLGMGKIIFARRFLGIEWVLHLLPLGGLTKLATGNPGHYRLRTFLMTLAGPALHAIVIVFMLAIRGVIILPPSRLIFFDLYFMIMIVNIIMLIVSLFPYSSASALGHANSDGLALLKLPRMSEQELHARYASYYGLHAMDAIEQHDYPAARRWAERGLALYANEHSLLNICGVVYSYTAEHEKARQVYLQVLGMTGISTELKYIAMNNVAYANLQLEDLSLLAQADEYSEQAFKNVPWHPSLIGTRGAVLVELGQVDVGIELLRMALKKTTNVQNKAQHACAIALGELKRGRLLHAQKYLEAARQFDSKCLQLEQVVRKLAIAQQL